MRNLFLVWLAQIALSGLVGAELCPGQKWSCPTGNTCCELPEGKEGCCPYANATCCQDKIHCCPQGLQCDLKAGGCKGPEESSATAHMSITNKGGIGEAMSFHRNSSVKNAICPDKSQCPNDQTCCQTLDTGFGCCPLANAVCCPDHAHCCPQGTKCDSERSVCYQVEDMLSNEITVQEIEGKEIKVNRPKDVDGPLEYIYCPGSTFYCPNGNTCCPRGGGHWNCCPLTSGVCCADLVHCCPFGHHCLSPSGCIRAGETSNATITTPFSMP